MIFPQHKLTKKIKSITKYPKPTNQKELGSFLRTASYHQKFVHALKKRAYQFTALTMKTRNRDRARRKGTPLIVVSNDWWLNLSCGFRTFAKIYHLYGRNRVRLRRSIDKSRLRFLPTHRKPTKQILHNLVTKRSE